ncbi:MAG TPA: amidohydrolase family protein [Gemmatimonadales bacterium]|nr:amidohydrolase family protein [Gemmatimonadales bacterium]
MIDVNVLLGAYPWRAISGTEPEEVTAVMDRLGIESAWASHLPSLYWKDPAEGNPWLYEVCARSRRFQAVPAIHPGLPHWEEDLREAVTHQAVAVRADPGLLGLAPLGQPMLQLVEALAAHGMPLLAAVRLEDGRGRHPLDVAPELAPWAVRGWLRHSPGLRVVVTHADRGFIEEVHFGSTPTESARVWWDISWVWGPPEDHLAHLLATLGPSRFLFGSGQPLRLAETPLARLDLLSLDPADRALIQTGNATALASRRVPR